MAREVVIAETSRGEQRVLAQEFIPVQQALLCCACECVYRVQSACPACGSKVCAPLAGWLQAKRAAMKATV